MASVKERQLGLFEQVVQINSGMGASPAKVKAARDRIEGFNQREEQRSAALDVMAASRAADPEADLAYRTRLGEFDAPKRSASRKGKTREIFPACPRHGADSVCEECPEQYHTDGHGFVHYTDAKGRTPLRRCEDCHGFKPKREWSQHDFFRCKACERPAPAPAPKPKRRAKKAPSKPKGDTEQAFRKRHAATYARPERDLERAVKVSREAVAKGFAHPLSSKFAFPRSSPTAEH